MPAFSSAIRELIFSFGNVPVDGGNTEFRNPVDKVVTRHRDQLRRLAGGQPPQFEATACRFTLS
jgi:hypothetical protein